MKQTRAVLIGLILVLSLLASCQSMEVDLSGLAGEIDKFPEMNSLPNLGVAYIGSDDTCHYFRIAKPYGIDRILKMNREELSIPSVFTVTDQMEQWRWMYGSYRENPLTRYTWLFSVDVRHYFIEVARFPIVLNEVPEAGMLVDAGHEPAGIEFTLAMMSTIHPAYHAWFNGLDYVLVVGFPPADDRRVMWVQTNHPEFVTSDGLRVGDTYEKVMEVNAPDETEIVFMGQCAVLKESGWIACFEWDTLEKGEKLRPSPVSKIEWFQK